MRSSRPQLACIILWLATISGLEHCQDNTVCPDGNTCCRGGCIASDLGPRNATCCSDGVTGCGVGYECQQGGGCIATLSVLDPLEQNLPRYRLCRPKRASLEAVRGFSVDDVGKLAYYSSHGDITRIDLTSIDFVFVAIHGAGRNADDYLCAATAASELQSFYHNVLILAPRFASIQDGPIKLREGGIALRWDGQGAGAWRYGARSTHPVQISSFAATDLLVETLILRTKAPIAVVGHSSGGQFVQRWSLLTAVWSSRLHAVVANPSSYAYLTRLRKIQGRWQVPCMTKCIHYNSWEWGLDPGGDTDSHYKDDAVQLLSNNVTKLIKRFSERNVVYLIGSQDRCNVSSSGGWCHSHGLETSCMDELQGSMRLERHFHFFESLKEVGVYTHRRHTVDGVGHDHSLMFTRPAGLAAIFGNQSMTANEWSLKKDIMIDRFD